MKNITQNTHKSRRLKNLLIGCLAVFLQNIRYSRIKRLFITGGIGCRRLASITGEWSKMHHQFQILVLPQKTLVQSSMNSIPISSTNLMLTFSWFLCIDFNKSFRLLSTLMILFCIWHLYTYTLSRPHNSPGPTIILCY